MITLQITWADDSTTIMNVRAWDYINGGILLVQYPEGDSEYCETVKGVKVI